MRELSEVILVDLVQPFSFGTSFEWWDNGWCESDTPISGYARLLTSRASMNVLTRVRSV